MDNKEKFYEMAKDFFDNELFKELYSSENLSICNVCDSAYMVFPYGYMKYGKCNFGTIITKTIGENLVNDNNYYLEFIKEIGPKKITENSYVLDEKAFRAFTNLKQRKLKDGPSKLIDKEFEEKLLNMKKGMRV